MDFIIIHDAYFYRTGLKIFLTEQKHLCLYHDIYYPEIDQKIIDLQPGLLLFGIHSAPLDEILKTIELIKRKAREVNILMIGDIESADLSRKCLMKGAQGLIFSNSQPSDFLEAIEALQKNQVYMPLGFRIHPDLKDIQEKRIPSKLDFELTSREKEILFLISTGLNNKQISEKLFISDQTVAVHRKNLFRKMGVKNSISLLRVAKEKRMIA